MFSSAIFASRSTSRAVRLTRIVPNISLATPSLFCRGFSLQSRKSQSFQYYNTANVAQFVNSFRDTRSMLLELKTSANRVLTSAIFSSSESKLVDFGRIAPKDLTLIIQLLHKCDLHEQAIETFRLFCQQHGHLVNPTHLCSLLKGLKDAGDKHQLGLEVYHECLASPLFPGLDKNVLIANCVIGLLEQSVVDGCVDSREKVLAAALKVYRGGGGSISCHIQSGGLMVVLAGKCQRFDVARDLYKDMLEKHAAEKNEELVDVNLDRCLLTAAIHCGKVEDCSEIYHRLLSDPAKLNKYVVCKLIEVCAQTGGLLEAFKLLEDWRRSRGVLDWALCRQAIHLRSVSYALESCNSSNSDNSTTTTTTTTSSSSSSSCSKQMAAASAGAERGAEYWAAVAQQREQLMRRVAGQVLVALNADLHAHSSRGQVRKNVYADVAHYSAGWAASMGGLDTLLQAARLGLFQGFSKYGLVSSLCFNLRGRGCWRELMSLHEHAVAIKAGQAVSPRVAPGSGCLVITDNDISFIASACVVVLLDNGMVAKAELLLRGFARDNRSVGVAMDRICHNVAKKWQATPKQVEFVRKITDDIIRASAERKTSDTTLV